MKQKNKEVDIVVLFGTLGANLLGNMLAGKECLREGDGVTRISNGVIRVGKDF